MGVAQQGRVLLRSMAGCRNLMRIAPIAVGAPRGALSTAGPAIDARRYRDRAPYGNPADEETFIESRFVTPWHSPLLHVELRLMLTECAHRPGRRVLVVDDHPDSADASCMLLSALGYECRPAVTGENALAEVERFHPDVVICDIGLPDISGYDIARTLRSRHGSALYLAALTGWDQPSARAHALAAGFDEHLVKPANARALRAVMAASLQRRVLLALGTGEYPTMR